MKRLSLNLPPRWRGWWDKVLAWWGLGVVPEGAEIVVTQEGEIIPAGNYEPFEKAPYDPLKPKPLEPGVKKARPRQSAKKNKQRDEAVEELLGLLEIEKRRKGSDRIPLRVFQSIDPSLCEYFSTRIRPDEWKDENNEDGRLFLMHPLVRPYDVQWINCCVAFTPPEDDREHGEKVGFARVRTTSPRALRGRAKFLYPWMLELTYAWMYPDRTYRCMREIVGSPDGVHWRHPNNGALADAEITRNIMMSISIELTKGFDWAVDIGYENNTSVRFITDPVGASAVFRLRDIPEGKKRRAALRHWVTDHYRQSRKDPNEKTRVRAHLRGAETFHWNGMTCRIVPSHFDLANAEQGILPRPKNHREYLDWKISPEEWQRRREYFDSQPKEWREELMKRG